MPTRARPGRAGRRLAGCLAALLLVGADAAPSPRKAEIQEKQDDLRQRLEALRREVAKREESQASAADQLRETESAISDANRRLRQLAEQRRAVLGEVAELERQGRRLNEGSEAQQAQLSRLLYRHFIQGESDALRLLLAGRDPNQGALDRQFLKYLSQAKAGLIADLRARAREKNRLAAAAKEKAVELADIEAGEQQARAGLLDQQKQRQALLARSAEQIRAQRREIGALERDDKRLSRLLENLARIVARPAARPPAKAPPTGRPPPAEREAAASRQEGGPGPEQAAGAFAALRGHLQLPVRGEIVGRFGKTRPEGGTAWKGLFIRAAEGSEVKAVAAGQVVFADWLRGFGNLLVVDHGDGFLSVYGNNQSLLATTGHPVRPGEAVATVGSSGGNAESGLYFELRHRGQAFDPLRWVSLR